MSWTFFVLRFLKFKVGKLKVERFLDTTQTISRCSIFFSNFLLPKIPFLFLSLQRIFPYFYAGTDEAIVFKKIICQMDYRQWIFFF
jgi:hypothetical protein